MDGWTLEELVRRVADALAADDVRAPNGRVREVPDARAIRWYATIGLVDRPTGFRGRTALYGPRHLLQAVAVKRRQAQGHALAQIQQELAGATDATLRRVARIPAESPSADGPPPGPAVAPAPLPAQPPAGPAPSHPPVPAGRRDRFWTTPPTGPTPPSPAPPTAPTVPTPPTAPAPPTAPTLPTAPSLPVLPPLAAAELRYRVVLPAGVALELPVAPSHRDLTDIRTSAEPLLRLLADRGLLNSEEPSDDDH